MRTIQYCRLADSTGSEYTIRENCVHSGDSYIPTGIKLTIEEGNKEEFFQTCVAFAEPKNRRSFAKGLRQILSGKDTPWRLTEVAVKNCNLTLAICRDNLILHTVVEFQMNAGSALYAKLRLEVPASDKDGAASVTHIQLRKAGYVSVTEPIPGGEREITFSAIYFNELEEYGDFHILRISETAW